jgi:hypothetical protein
MCAKLKLKEDEELKEEQEQEQEKAYDPTKIEAAAAFTRTV